jgi:hypothetical protein
MKKIAIFAGILALGLGAMYFYGQYKKLTNICFTFAGFEISKINRERITLTIKLNVKNQSNIGIKLSSYDFNVYMNEAYVAKIVSVNPITGKPIELDFIAPNKFSVLSLILDVEPKKNKALANWDFISKILLDVNNIKIKIVGNMAVNVGNTGIRKFPLTIGPVALKEMMPDKSIPSQPCV